MVKYLLLKIERMKKETLLPSKAFWLGLCITIPFAILGALSLYSEFEFPWLNTYIGEKDPFTANQNLTDEVALSGTIIGLLLMSFARTKGEDEYIRELRLQSWQWAVLINYIVLIVGIWLIYDTNFIYLMVYNMLTVLVIFLLRFRYLLFRNRSVND